MHWFVLKLESRWCKWTLTHKSDLFAKQNKNIFFATTTCLLFKWEVKYWSFRGTLCEIEISMIWYYEHLLKMSFGTKSGYCRIWVGCCWQYSLKGWLRSFQPIWKIHVAELGLWEKVFYILKLIDVNLILKMIQNAN